MVKRKLISEKGDSSRRRKKGPRSIPFGENQVTEKKKEKGHDPRKRGTVGVQGNYRWGKGKAPVKKGEVGQSCGKEKGGQRG